MGNLKKKLSRNELTIGTWLTIPHQSIVEVFSTANFEWITIDIEHSAIDYRDVMNLLGHIQGNGMEALVRVSKNEEVVIKKVMDAGADGIIVPMINSKSDAEKAVSLVKYPPKGKRGVGLSRAQKYGPGFEEYKTWVEEEAVVIAQIEHIDAVNNIDSILSVPGIDGILVGPYDLSASLGLPGDYNNNNVKEALRTVEEAARAKNVPFGFHVIESEAEEVFRRQQEGCTLIVFSVDFLFLGNKVREEMTKLVNGRFN